MGEKIVKQIENFCRLPEGSVSCTNVLHMVNFENIPSAQIKSMQYQVLKGAKEISGNVDGIEFLNNK